MINVKPVGQAILPANSSFRTAVEQEPPGRVSWRKQQETSWTWSRHTLGSGSFLCLNSDNQPYIAVLLFSECMTNKGGDTKATMWFGERRRWPYKEAGCVLSAKLSPDPTPLSHSPLLQGVASLKILCSSWLFLTSIIHLSIILYHVFILTVLVNSIPHNHHSQRVPSKLRKTGKWIIQECWRPST